MRILIVLTYYKPYKSGLTIYAMRKARALAAHGHAVTVLTSRYDPALPLTERDQGVDIIRLPVAFHLSKGVIMPQMPFKAWGLIGDTDVVHLHLPQGDAALVAMLAKLQGKPLVSTYHCDIKMPDGMINALAGWGANLSNHISASLSDVLVHNTRDFAEHSSFLRKYLDKLIVIRPPIIVDPVEKADVDHFVDKYGLDPSRTTIGMVSRLATEKGVEYLVAAFPEVLNSYKDAQVVFVGNYQNVIGESAYREKLLPLIAQLGNRWKFLGMISEKEKASFFHFCDVLVLPSINSTESFGMVQVEAMTCGTPVVASNLPGVRQPVGLTAMGKIVPIKDPKALAEGIIAALRSSDDVNPEVVKTLKEEYSPDSVASAYEDLYQALLESNE